MVSDMSVLCGTETFTHVMMFAMGVLMLCILLPIGYSWFIWRWRFKIQEYDHLVSDVGVGVQGDQGGREVQGQGSREVGR